MNAMIPFLLSRYIVDITGMIAEKYGMESGQTLHKFLFSETYRMLSTPSLRMWDFTSDVLFEMWECEQVTGDPRNSVYIRFPRYESLFVQIPCLHDGICRQ